MNQQHVLIKVFMLSTIKVHFKHETIHECFSVKMSKFASFSMTLFVKENLKPLYYVVCIFRAQRTRIEHSRAENGFGRRVEFAISGRRRTNLNIIIRARRTAMNHSDRTAIELFFIFHYGR